jgi:hypothetical protein
MPGIIAWIQVMLTAISCKITEGYDSIGTFWGITMDEGFWHFLVIHSKKM